MIPNGIARPKVGRTLMTPDEAFIEAIRDAPDDDTPRLIYADWLEEHGDPHGEFIRVQCALAKLCLGDPRRGALARRERELWERHKRTWLGGRKREAGGLKTFVRGFRFFTRFGVYNYPPYDTYCTRWAPLQSITLYSGGGPKRDPGPEAGERLGICPSLDGWLQLEALGGLSANWLPPLLASPHLHRLRELHLHYVRLDTDGVRALAELTNLPNLRKLSLKMGLLGDRMIAALADAPLLGGLTSLRCSGGNLTDAGAQALATSPYLDNLQDLDLRGNDAISRQTRQLLYVRFGNRVHF
jgi:uncharacterized protein (TIGR02996 family)